jgi:IMP dehydrogenase
MSSVVNGQNFHHFVAHRTQLDLWVQYSDVPHCGDALPVPTTLAVRWHELSDPKVQHHLKHLLTLGHRVCLDIANGHDMSRIKQFVSLLGSPRQLVVGNIATADAYLRIAELGVGAIRVGIGCGGTCLTTANTGIGYPTLQSVLDCRVHRCSFNPKAHTPNIIADGGVKGPADAMKLFCAGADQVMMGSYFAGIEECPDDYRVGDYQLLRGEASASAKGKDRFVEGGEGRVLITTTLSDKLRHLREGMQSALSYLACNNMQELQDSIFDVQLAEISIAGRQQHKAHAV